MKMLNDFVETNEELFRQEELILEATELIARMMNQNGVSKTELAAKLGKSKAYVTQCLSGEQNLTLRTLSDLFGALGYRMQVGAEALDGCGAKSMHRLYPIGGWSFEQSSLSHAGNVIDCAASAVDEERYDFCEAAA
jgi:antitoxin component HigA of HigAB toxin-antitoxin module